MSQKNSPQRINYYQSQKQLVIPNKPKLSKQISHRMSLQNLSPSTTLSLKDDKLKKSPFQNIQVASMQSVDTQSSDSTPKQMSGNQNIFQRQLKQITAESNDQNIKFPSVITNIKKKVNNTRKSFEHFKDILKTENDDNNSSVNKKPINNQTKLPTLEFDKFKSNNLQKIIQSEKGIRRGSLDVKLLHRNSFSNNLSNFLDKNESPKKLKSKDSLVVQEQQQEVEVQQSPSSKFLNKLVCNLAEQQRRNSLDSSLSFIQQGLIQHLTQQQQQQKQQNISGSPINLKKINQLKNFRASSFKIAKDNTLDSSNSSNQANNFKSNLVKSGTIQIENQSPVAKKSIFNNIVQSLQEKKQEQESNSDEDQSQKKMPYSSRKSKFLPANLKLEIKKVKLQQEQEKHKIQVDQNECQEESENEQTSEEDSLDSSNTDSSEQSDSDQIEITCFLCEEEPHKMGRINTCNHEFCFTCIANWNLYNQKCPVCEKQFQTITKQTIHEFIDTTKQKKEDEERELQQQEELIKQNKQADLVQGDVALSQSFIEKKIETPFYNCYLCQKQKNSTRSVKYCFQDKSICQICFLNKYKTCFECQSIFFEKLQKFKDNHFCNSCFDKIQERYCFKCKIMLEDNNTSCKTMKNGHKLCKSCFFENYCFFCLDKLKSAFTLQIQGKVCLSCYPKYYCCTCKECVINCEINPNCQTQQNQNEKTDESKNFKIKYHEKQKKEFLYCKDCYKKNFCRLCDKMLYVNSSFKKGYATQEFICEECRTDLMK